MTRCVQELSAHTCTIAATQPGSPAPLSTLRTHRRHTKNAMPSAGASYLTQCFATVHGCCFLCPLPDGQHFAIDLCHVRLHRFVKNQLVVEITSSAKLAHLFGWIMRRHSLIAYSLYTAGNGSLRFFVNAMTCHYATCYTVQYSSVC